MGIPLILSFILFQTAVTAISSNSSIFPQRTFLQNDTIPNITEYCQAPDSEFSNLNCTTDNSTYYSYTCIQDQSSKRCIGQIGTSSQGVQSYLNLVSNIKNTSYQGRSDYDLSSCTINSTLFQTNCTYLISGVYVAPPPINILNTTFQRNPYAKFCHMNFSEVNNAVSTGTNFTLNCSSGGDKAFMFTQRHTCIGGVVDGMYSVGHSCQFILGNGSWRNQTIYLDTLTKFVNNVDTEYVDVLENLQNTSGILQFQFKFTYNKTFAQAVSPVICVGSISTMTQVCTNDSSATQSTYNCYYDVNSNLVCQQDNSLSTGVSQNETKYTVRLNGLQYFQYGSNNQVNIRYCKTDYTTLNQNCIFLYSFYQSDVNVYQKNNLTLTFENTGSTVASNLNLYWLDYYGNYQFYQQLVWGYIFQQQTYTGDTWLLLNANDNSTVLTYVVKERSQYLKIPGTSAFQTNPASTIISFTNQLDFAVQISYLDFYSHEITQAYVGSTGSFSQYTKVGTQYLIRNNQTQLELFSYFASATPQSYNITPSLVAQTTALASTQLHLQINCTGQLLNGVGQQLCSDNQINIQNFYQYNCTQQSQSVQCISQFQYNQANVTQYKFTLLQSNITFLVSNTSLNTAIVMSCTNNFDNSGSFNQSCLQLFKIYIPTNLSRWEYYKLNNSTVNTGILLSQNQSISINIFQKTSGNLFFSIFNNQTQISQCQQYQQDGLYYCTTDTTGLNFTTRQCNFDFFFQYISCYQTGIAQCQSFNASGCKYSIYYDKDYDWDTYYKYVQLQNQLLNSITPAVQNATPVNPYKHLQLQISYNGSNFLSQAVDSSQGNICFTIDQNYCLNPLNTGASQNGTYCYTQNLFSCYKDFGSNCNLTSGFNCSTYDGVNLQYISYCVSKDNSNCYQDKGQLCNSLNLLDCNISIYTKTCQTSNGQNCYQLSKGWRYTQDGSRTYNYDQSNGLSGYYCISIDGVSCNSVKTVITSQNSFSCITFDNINCYQDLGQLCNSTMLTWCNINSNVQQCLTNDMKSCQQGLWILSNKSQDLSGNSTYCYSNDGLDCKSFQGGPVCQTTNQLSTYLCQYQYDSVALQYTSSLNTIYQCLSYDGINCFSDLQSNCAIPGQPQNSFCGISVSNKYCLTSNQVNCSNFGPGWYYTNDGQLTNVIYSNLANQIGSYCYSSNGQSCDKTFGFNCNPITGSNCSSVDRINLVKTIECIRNNSDSTKCLRDQGQLCKPASTNYDGSCGLANQVSCISNDNGVTCLDQVSGWYFTQDGLNVYNQNFPNGLKGKYCYSQDQQTCLINYDPQCSSMQDKTQCINTTKCVTVSGQQCYYDSGSLCNSTSRLNGMCNLNYFANNCSSQLSDGVNCYQSSLQLASLLSASSQQSQLNTVQNNFNWCFSTDGNVCSFNDSQTSVGIYCQSQDGYYCFRDYGPNCNLNTGYMCSTLDRVNLDTVAYCASTDGRTCVRDQGQFCGQKISQYCKIPNYKFCITNDNNNCYEFLKRWYFTLDQISVYTGSLSKGLAGSYCYSYDGVACKTSYQNFISSNITNCITQNNQSCYQDKGILCASPESINYCFINNATNNCPTVDGANCSNLSWIKRRSGDSLCYSIDGKNCMRTLGGIYCSSNSDYLCSYTNNIIQPQTVCLSYDQINCFNCTISDPTKCYNQGDTQNYCNTINGVNCIQLVSGWYYTNDGQQVSNLPQVYGLQPNNGVPGFYCYSNNSYQCIQSYGTNCSINNGKTCAKNSLLNYMNTTKCITQDSQSCFRDKGTSCAPIKKKNAGGSCDLQPNLLSCDTYNQNGTCFDYITGWYFTLDGNLTYQNQSTTTLMGTYCFSKNGTSCFQNNGSECDFKTGYKCSTIDRLNPKNVTYCISNDNLTCLQDSGSYCNQTGDLTGRCNVYNNSNNCQTLDGMTCYKNKKGMYLTIDGLNVDTNSPNKQTLLRSYCYSEDGNKCKQDYGQNCNTSTGYLCSTLDGISLVKSSYCITYDNRSCYQDYGLLCNFTGQNAWCNLNNNSKLCSTLDGLVCYNFIPGWYYTLDSVKVSSGQVNQSQIGSYCYSNDGQNCYGDYGSTCNPNTGYMCSTKDGVNPTKVNYCLSSDKITCKQDNGQFCNFTGSQKWCNIYVYQQSCMTMLGSNQCFNMIQRWELTYDGVNVNQNPAGNNGFLATYCYTKDGQLCYQNYGEKCDPVTGLYCSTSNGANLQLGSYCISLNKQTCYKDIGNLCNNTGQLNWCNFKNQTSYCFTKDGLSCFNNVAQYCFTFDGQSCTTLKTSNTKGTYCWSDNSVSCTTTNTSYCSLQPGQICTPSNVTQTFCITQDNMTCLADTGYYCNNTYDFTSCNINFDLTYFCLTNNSMTCLKLNTDPVKSQSIDTIQRSIFRNYFFYSIKNITSIANVSQPGVCDPSCSKIKDMCCVSVKRQAVGGLVPFDNLCMNKFVAQSQINVQLQGFTYVLNCVEQKLQQNFSSILKSYAVLTALTLYLLNY